MAEESELKSKTCDLWEMKIKFSLPTAYKDVECANKLVDTLKGTGLENNPLAHLNLTLEGWSQKTSTLIENMESTEDALKKDKIILKNIGDGTSEELKNFVKQLKEGQELCLPLDDLMKVETIVPHIKTDDEINRKVSFTYS